MKCEQIRFLHRPLRDHGVHKETPRLLIIHHIVLHVADHMLRLFTLHKVADTVPARSGSSPAYSKVRPFRGSRARSTPPPNVMLNPCARSSWPITVPNSQAES